MKGMDCGLSLLVSLMNDLRRERWVHFSSWSPLLRTFELFPFGGIRLFKFGDLITEFVDSFFRYVG